MGYIRTVTIFLLFQKENEMIQRQTQNVISTEPSEPPRIFAWCVTYNAEMFQNHLHSISGVLQSEKVRIREYSEEDCKQFHICRSFHSCRLIRGDKIFV